jgi:hypothetical protein
MRGTQARIALLASVAWAVGCAGTTALADSRFPPRPEGCEVRLFHQAPDGPTTNIGPVRADCALDVTDPDCLRTLEDQACKLGGDIVWGVADKPQVSGDKNHWEARAAHTGAFPLR